jgi:hypothetical protein
MANFDPMQPDIDRHYRRELLAHAEQSRLAASVRRPRRTVRIIHVYGPLLFHLGGLLMTWGKWMRTFYQQRTAYPVANDMQPRFDT